MTKKSETESQACCATESVSKGDKCCCQVDGLVAIDERGQIVLPKDVREKASVKAGDKFVVISSGTDGEAGCIFLVKANYFNETIKGMLGPMMKEILQ